MDRRNNLFFLSENVAAATLDDAFCEEIAV